MARLKITEYLAKTILYPAFNLKFHGMTVTPETTASELLSCFPHDNLVLKLDQGVKKRGKLGLVKVNLSPSEIPPLVAQWCQQGWTNFLVEPVFEHDAAAEHYLALTRIRTGWQISYSPKGGIDVESHWDQLTSVLPPNLQKLVNTSLLPLLDTHHISFLEINPLLIRSTKIIPLDMAVEVDSAGSLLPTLPDRVLAQSEQDVLALDQSTPASLKFRLLNPKGKIWVLLSGGGASLVLADEVADLGLGQELANYGEYSGAPTDDDVYSYTKIILKQLLSSNNHKPQTKLAIIIAGGVANFTDVAKTFRGLIRALDEYQSELKRSHVKVFVRRGGPNEVRGLSLMRTFLQSADLLGSIYGHTTPLTQVVSDVKEYLS